LATLRQTLGIFGVILLLMVGGLGMIRRQPSELYFLAFVSQEYSDLQVYRILPDGSYLKRLTDFQEGYDITEILWSPDAQWLAIQAWIRIYITSINGAGFQKVSQGPELSESFNPIWSPDSTALLFHYIDADAQIQAIYLFQVPDYQLKLISKEGQDLVNFWLGGWARDSQSFLVTASDGTNRQFYLVSRDGKIIQQITHNQEYNYFPVAFSLDHSWNLFQDSDYPHSSSLYSINLASMATTKLFTSTYISNVWDAKWSPNGQWIVFTGRQGDETKLYRIRRDGKYLFELASGDTNQSIYFIDFDWSPDSQWIAYLRNDGMYKIRWDGRANQKLLQQECYYQFSTSEIRWSPDGRWLVYDANDCGSERKLYLIASDGQKQHQLHINDQSTYGNYITVPRWSPIIDLDWHGFALAALGCGAIVLGFLLRFLKKWQHQPF
jgi:Tol biopolymer transport system component